jgi:hypothetical protein
MTSLDLVSCLNGTSPARLRGEEFDALLAAATVVREENTGIAGMLRVLTLGEWVLVQEETPQREILLRARPDLEAAMAFVDRRLQRYEKMWDG